MNWNLKPRNRREGQKKQHVKARRRKKHEIFTEW